jgi:hypothetical protein
MDRAAHDVVAPREARKGARRRKKRARRGDCLASRRPLYRNPIDKLFSHRGRRPAPKKCLDLNMEAHFPSAEAGWALLSTTPRT